MIWKHSISVKKVAVKDVTLWLSTAKHDIKAAYLRRMGNTPTRYAIVGIRPRARSVVLEVDTTSDDFGVRLNVLSAAIEECLPKELADAVKVPYWS